VLSRDGKVCAAPGCANRGTLFAHHVVFRSHGGRTAIENEVCLCQSCHSLVHEGLLQVEGEAPHGLRWFDREGRAIDTRLTADNKTIYYTLESDRFTMESGQNDPRGSSGSREPTKEEEDSTIYSLDEVPDEVDSAWWRKYGHNFEFKGKRLMLKKAR
jgi:hypothetical protein